MTSQPEAALPEAQARWAAACKEYAKPMSMKLSQSAAAYEAVDAAISLIALQAARIASLERENAAAVGDERMTLALEVIDYLIDDMREIDWMSISYAVQDKCAELLGDANKRTAQRIAWVAKAKQMEADREQRNAESRRIRDEAAAQAPADAADSGVTE